MAIQILNEAPLALGFVSGRVRKAGYHLTTIVKGVCKLTPGRLALETEKPLLEGDVPEDPDEPSSDRYASDFAPFKPKADVTLVGTCHVGPGERTGRAMFRLGALRKTLLVHGDRQFIARGGGRHDISEPLPFRSMPLRYERAFGGQGFPSNPIGRGFAVTLEGRRPLPNVELVASPIRSPQDRPEPAGFGPLDRRWIQRTQKLGTYDRAWLSKDWPYFPDDFDWSYFNAAPSDQQLPYLRGDEPFVLEGMHADLARLEAELPGARPRCFVRRRREGEETTEEVLLSLDTVAIDVDRAEVSIVWRGLVPVRSREAIEIEKALLVVESLADAPQPAEHYLHPTHWEKAAPSQEDLANAEDAAARGEPVEMPSPPRASPEPSPEEIAELDQARKDLEDAHVDPALLERLRGVASAASFAAILMANMPTDEDAGVDEAEAKAAEETKQAVGTSAKPASAAAERRAQDKRELDAMRADMKAANADPALLDKLDKETKKSGLLRVLFGSLPPSASAEEAKERSDVLAFVTKTEEDQEAEERAEEAIPRAARGEHLTREEALAIARNGGSLANANLIELDLADANLEGVNMAGANLSGARLARAHLRGTDLSGATLRLADLAGASLVGAIAADANLEACHLGGANLTEATLSRAILTGAHLEDALLDGADLTGAKLERASLSRASLRGALFEDADMRSADLQKARGPKASFRRARLDEARLDGAGLEGAIFIESEISRATFDGATLREAHLNAASGTTVSFRGADLTNARANGARLRGARFQKVRAEKSNWSDADLESADFEDAALGTANFTGANLTGASFHSARSVEAIFSKAILAGAKLTRANLFRSRFGGADLSRADCRASNLFECDFFEANTDGIRLERSNVGRTCLVIRSVP